MLDLFLIAGAMVLFTVARTVWAALCTVLGGYYLTAPEIILVIHVARKAEIDRGLVPRSVKCVIEQEGKGKHAR